MTLDEIVSYINKSNISLYITTTGGGAGIQQLLWEPAGTSNFLVGASFPYSTDEFDSFIGYQKKDKYCSQDAATELAMASYIKAKQYTLNHSEKNNPVGVGVSCAVSTNRDRRGDNVAFISICDSNRITFTFVRITEPARIEQGFIIDHAVLAALYETISYKESGDDNLVMGVRELVPQTTRELFFQHPYFAVNNTRWSTTVKDTFIAGSFNPLHDAHRDIAYQVNMEYSLYPVYMITVDSVHKKSLRVSEMLDRVAIIRNDKYSTYNNIPVIFTENDPLFIDKARKFPYSNFVIGYDTAERMLDPKWGPEIMPMLHEFRKLGTRFIVAARKINGEVKTMKDLLIPEYFDGNMFRELYNNPVEISSTQIRENGK